MPLLPLILRSLIILIALSFASAVSAQSPQNSNSIPPAYNGASERMEGAHVMPIPNASFFAKAELESTRTLTDGTTVTRRTYNIIARDLRGRTHNESRLWMPADGSEPRLTYSVVYDPVTRARTFLYPATRLARQFIVKPPDDAATKTVAIVDPKAPTIQKDDLGTNLQDGLQLKGSREIRTYPLGSLGNDKPLTITTEYWYSADLQLNISVKRTDPRFGMQTVRVTNLHREEPDPSLFDVPADYKLVNENGPDTVASSGGSSPSNRIRMGGTVEAAKLINRVQPVYPMEARKAHIQGTVRLHVIVQKDGTIEELEVLSGHPMLLQSAIDAVSQWRYAPTLLNGEPVEVDTTVDVIFSLN
jgi:TonB family protein